MVGAVPHAALSVMRFGFATYIVIAAVAALALVGLVATTAVIGRSGSTTDVSVAAPAVAAVEERAPTPTPLATTAPVPFPDEALPTATAAPLVLPTPTASASESPDAEAAVASSASAATGDPADVDGTNVESETGTSVSEATDDTSPDEDPDAGDRPGDVSGDQDQAVEVGGAGDRADGAPGDGDESDGDTGDGDQADGSADGARGAGPSATPTVQPTATPAPTATALPTSTATPEPTVTPEPTATPLPITESLDSGIDIVRERVTYSVDSGWFYVDSTTGLLLRSTPGGDVLRALEHRDVVFLTGQGTEFDLREWVQVESPARGWVASEFLSPREPAAIETVVVPSSGEAPTAADWAALRDCESSGNYSVVSPNGLYHGAYQFLPSTWDDISRRSGRPDLVGVLPSAAAPGDQDAMALALYALQGPSPWPVCGQALR